MRFRKTIGARHLWTAAVTLAAFLAAGDTPGTRTAAAQDSDPRSLVVFDQENFAGTSKTWSLTARQPFILVPFVGPEMNERIASLKLGAEVGVLLFQRPHFASRDDACGPKIGSDDQPGLWWRGVTADFEPVVHGDVAVNLARTRDTDYSSLILYRRDLGPPPGALLLERRIYYNRECANAEHVTYFNRVFLPVPGAATRQHCLDLSASSESPGAGAKAPKFRRTDELRILLPARLHESYAGQRHQLRAELFSDSGCLGESVVFPRGGGETFQLNEFGFLRKARSARISYVAGSLDPYFVPATETPVAAAEPAATLADTAAAAAETSVPPVQPPTQTPEPVVTQSDTQAAAPPLAAPQEATPQLVPLPLKPSPDPLPEPPPLPVAVPAPLQPMPPKPAPEAAQPATPSLQAQPSETGVSTAQNLEPPKPSSEKAAVQPLPQAAPAPTQSATSGVAASSAPPQGSSATVEPLTPFPDTQAPATAPNLQAGAPRQPASTLAVVPRTPAPAPLPAPPQPVAPQVALPEPQPAAPPQPSIVVPQTSSAPNPGLPTLQPSPEPQLPLSVEPSQPAVPPARPVQQALQPAPQPLPKAPSPAPSEPSQPDADAPPTDPGAETFRYPAHEDYRLNFCYRWGSQCGQPAAQAWCKAQGFVGVMSWKRDAHVGALFPTIVMGDERICDRYLCDGFEEITCTR